MTDTIDLDSAKLEAYDAIDLAAGAARSILGTNIFGQLEIYREKYEQAIDFLSTTGQSVDYNDYPLLQLEANIVNLPIKNIAELIVKRRSNWISKITAIESLRLTGKYNIAVCTNVDDIRKLTSYTINKLSEFKRT